jgi:HTH-type transcriptional regulator/antitoxin HigA|tara:strand:- start:450 stop:884 length:435 start_codon:yes stop_codon:yes gene_type:complete
MEIQSVPPPGQFIREELEAREWTQRDLAYILDTPEQAVNVIISGKRGISPEMAKAFGKAFDVPPEFFLNLQKAYDLSRAREPDPGIEKRATLQAVYPIREMIRRGWLEDSDAAMLEVQVIRFFGQNRLEDIPHLAHARPNNQRR